MMTEKLARGIWPALCTGFDDTAEHVATDRIQALLRTLIDAGSNGFFVCGGTGEGRFMSVAERKSVAEVAAAEAMEKMGQIPKGLPPAGLPPVGLPPVNLPKQLPALPIEPLPVAAPVITPSGPPVPEEGLPSGWTMEQWTHYGHQWLERNGRA